VTVRFSSRPFFRSRARRAAALVLCALSLGALAADVIASDAPIILWQDGNTYVLPAVTHPAVLGERTAAGLARELGDGDRAWWPLVRSGPGTPTGLPPFSSPSRSHPLGTDAFGRDVLARVVHGARTSLAMAAVVTVLATLLGAVIGGTTAVLGGTLDALAERAVEIVCVFPVVVVVALVRTVEHRTSLTSLVFILVAVKSAEVVRLTRVLVLRCLAEDWALSARAAGSSPLRVLRVDVLPHLVFPLAQAGALAAASVVLTETALAFLELGAPAALVSWGDLLAQVRWGAGAFTLVPPMVALGLTVGALQSLAGGLRGAPERGL
jgi:peptide/nickel transport system permease protein